MIPTPYIDALKEVVNATFDLDIMVRTRQREYVDARMTFAYILLQEGATLQAVALYLGMNHASIYHYKSRFPWLVKYDSILKEKYDLIMSINEPRPESAPIYSFTKHELIQEVLTLREEVNVLTSEKEKRLAAQRKEVNLAPLYEVVKERTRSGREAYTKQHLVKFFNGLS